MQQLDQEERREILELRGSSSPSRGKRVDVEPTGAEL